MVFIILWIFQVLFFESFYRKVKLDRIDDVADNIVDIVGDDGIVDDDYNNLYHIAVDNDISIKVYSKYMYAKCDISTAYNDFTQITGYNQTAFYIKDIRESSNGEVSYIVRDERSEKEILVYGCVIGSKSDPQGYLLLGTPLELVDSTVTIIKEQMYIISAILIILGFVISFLASKMISDPIIKITKSAKNLGKGDYNVTFEGKGYDEAETLAETLTYAAKEISRADTLQRDLIANVSHDLRTPLTMLKAYAEMIRDLSGNNPIKRQEHLNIIIEETDRLAMLVTDMLDLSKMESGKDELNCTVFDISSKLSDIMTRYKGISERMGYNIYFEPDESAEVCCDVVKIEQVIYNLINNAINYTGEDKSVYVKQINQPEGVRIEVRDTGQGISPENIKLIFDKYYRSENHKREVVGTGLGLSIVKAILKKHNFAYGVQSTLGKGSTFWFVINRAKQFGPEPMPKELKERER